ncbi:hypothetical protein K0M31_007147 [Melipona bicolor]|uniref:Uncharacterized protein n=1 Tax=Melipona bicolor TaxID=60889 RepID=A0AA40KL49_9HYME|nr:hypothetical protein K0M31_007147 [Melipona bicolor]
MAVLLKKDAKFEFGGDQQLAFRQLKLPLVYDRVLKLYHIGAEMELHGCKCRSWQFFCNKMK